MIPNEDEFDDPITAHFQIGDHNCYAAFLTVDEAYQWLLAQHNIRPLGVYQGATVWHDMRSFAPPAPKATGGVSE